VKAQDKICEEEEIQDYGFSSIIIATFCWDDKAVFHYYF
jgi:hypothetical protein